MDLGIKSLAVTSGGDTYQNPKALGHALKRLVRRQRELARHERGSHNRAKTRAKIARLHDRITCLRQNAIHQATSRIVAKTKPDLERSALVVMEDLNVAGMMQTCAERSRSNGKLARAVADVGMGEFVRQMAYKCAWNGTGLVQADCWFPSSKQCSRCGQVKTTLTLAEHVYRCEGFHYCFLPKKNACKCRRHLFLKGKSCLINAFPLFQAFAYLHTISTLLLIIIMFT